MKNISQTKLKILLVVVLPIDEQWRLAKIIAFVRDASKLGDFDSNSALALNAFRMSRLHYHAGNPKEVP